MCIYFGQLNYLVILGEFVCVYGIQRTISHAFVHTLAIIFIFWALAFSYLPSQCLNYKCAAICPAPLLSFASFLMCTLGMDQVQILTFKKQAIFQTELSSQSYDLEWGQEGRRFWTLKANTVYSEEGNHQYARGKDMIWWFYWDTRATIGILNREVYRIDIWFSVRCNIQETKLWTVLYKGKGGQHQ
jgi:hypothetical protein